MVTATTGTLKFRGRDGRTLDVSIYISDVAAAFWTFDYSGVAGTGSPNFLSLPPGTIWDLTEMVTLLAPTVSTISTLLVDGQPTGKMVAIGTTLVTLATRSHVDFSVMGGKILTAKQL
jgi:hypothetical protein